jgi:AcrR family transcriptional regulator
MDSAYRKTQIAALAESLFLTYGIKSVTVEDITRRAGMSKKTFYLIYEDKTALVNAVVQEITNRVKRNMLASCHLNGEFENDLHQLKRLSGRLFEIRNIFNDKALSAYAAALKIIQEFKEGFLRNRISESLTQGMKQGWYRDDISVKNLTEVFLMQINLILHYPGYRPEIAMAAQEIFLNGLLRPELALHAAS